MKQELKIKLCCPKCESYQVEEWGIIRNGDTRIQTITYLCDNCMKTFKGEPQNY